MFVVLVKGLSQIISIISLICNCRFCLKIGFEDVVTSDSIRVSTLKAFISRWIYSYFIIANIKCPDTRMCIHNMTTLLMLTTLASIIIHNTKCYLITTVCGCKLGRKSRLLKSRLQIYRRSTKLKTNDIYLTNLRRKTN